MIYWILGGGLLIYLVGSYVIVARWLKDSPGPAGLGWLVWPWSPVFLPVAGLYMLKAAIHHWTR